MTMALNIGRRLAWIVLAVAALAACAKPVKVEPPLLLWPLPPERPRIKFVDLIVGSLDLKQDRPEKFKQIVFGAERETRFTKPLFVAARGGVMFVSDIGMVHIYDFANSDFGIMGLGGLVTPTGLAVDSKGTVYVADSSKGAVFVYRKGAKGVTRLGEPGDLVSPGGIALDEEAGRVIVADAKQHALVVFSTDGAKLSVIGKRGADPGEFNFPYDVAVGPEGKLYVVDGGNFRIQVLDRNGVPLNVFGQAGAEAGMFARPKGIAVDSDGHLYVVDSAFGGFQIFDEFGRGYLVVGTGGQGPGQFSLPAGIAIDENDRVYVVDQMNHRVQIFQYLKYPDEQRP
jgi:DNA-binding beta-propeller fold protein YncE